MKKDPRQHAVRLSVNRREAVAMVGAPLVAWPSMVNATLPPSAPQSLEDFLLYSRPLIYTGRIRRMLFKEDRTDAAAAPERELRLVERQDARTIDIGFLEIDDARPVLMGPAVTKGEEQGLVGGRVYSHWWGLGKHEGIDAHMASMLGKPAVLFSKARATFVVTPGLPVPEPLFLSAASRHWGGNLPRPIEELPAIVTQANRHGFRPVATR